MRLTSFILFFALLCGGCSPTHPVFMTFLTPFRKPPSAVFNADQLQQKIAARLAANEHLAALTLIGSAIQESEGVFSRQYPSALNGVLVKAQGLQNDDQPLAAGTLYRSARFNYPLTSELTRQAAMTLTEIDACIELCANRLLEKGLYAYRQGHLEDAIETWSVIDRFHPEHAASQRAIATTRIQLETLQNIKP